MWDFAGMPANSLDEFAERCLRLKRLSEYLHGIQAGLLELRAHLGERVLSYHNALMGANISLPVCAALNDYVTARVRNRAFTSEQWDNLKAFPSYAEEAIQQRTVNAHHEQSDTALLAPLFFKYAAQDTAFGQMRASELVRVVDPETKQMKYPSSRLDYFEKELLRVGRFLTYKPGEMSITLDEFRERTQRIVEARLTLRNVTYGGNWETMMAALAGELTRPSKKPHQGKSFPESDADARRLFIETKMLRRFERKSRPDDVRLNFNTLFDKALRDDMYAWIVKRYSLA